MNTTTETKLPYRLTYVMVDGKPSLVPGYGNAGWTVGTFATCAAALKFMGAYPQAAMPCWKRFGKDGVSL